MLVMRQLKALSLALLATFALTATANAQGLPNILPEKGAAEMVKTTTTVEIRNNGKKHLSCAGASGTLEDEGAAKGPFHIKITGCSTAGGLIKCTGLRDFNRR
jgi:hypothetical protein